MERVVVLAKLSVLCLMAVMALCRGLRANGKVESLSTSNASLLLFYVLFVKRKDALTF